MWNQDPDNPDFDPNDPTTNPAAPNPKYRGPIYTAGGVEIWEDEYGNPFTRDANGVYTPYTGGQSNTKSGPAQPPPGTPPPPGKSTGGGGLITPWGQTFTPPPMADTPGAPSFTPPAYTPPPAFAQPTYDEARNDPGFQFVQREGQKALENSAAARGVLNSGGTLKDIAQWNQSLADTQYQNVFNRDLSQYTTNYGTQFKDPYEIAYKGALDQFTPQLDVWKTNAAATQRSNEFNYLNAYDQYKFQYQQWLDRIHESETLHNY